MLRVDFETRSTEDLPKIGVSKYASHHTTDTWCMAYTFEDDEDADPEIWIMGEPLPDKIRQYVMRGGLVGAWNAAFELAIWNKIMVVRYGWPPLLVSQCRCTMMMAGAMSLPLGLDNCAKALSVGLAKDKTGYGLMLRMSRPRKIEDDGTVVWWNVAERLKKLYLYCKQDVRVERKLAGKLRDLMPSEQKLWELDQKINARGIPVDIASVTYMINWCSDERERPNKRMNKVTSGKVRDCSDLQGLKVYTRVSSVSASVLPDMIELATGPQREALELRAAFAKTSTKKLDAFLKGTTDDGCMRDIFQFYGAPSTGRWAGRRVQPQNLPRPTCSQAEIERRIDERDFKSLLEIADCIRAMIAADKGEELVCADFSSIEARVLAWIAGQRDVLKVFEKGGDIYKHEAQGIFGVSEAEVSKDQRQVGKVAILALGYQGAKGAFNSMAANYGVKLPDARVEAIVQAWRTKNNKIVDFWYALDHAAQKAIKQKGVKVKVGAITMRHAKGHLWIKLPSGRLLCFPRAKMKMIDKPWGRAEGIGYVGQNGYTHKIEWLSTYGGKICENIIQGIARDLLAGAMLRVERVGYKIVGHIHDEIFAPLHDGGSLDEFEREMATMPDWAKGLPMKAEGWAGRRFRK